MATPEMKSISEERIVSKSCESFTSAPSRIASRALLITCVISLSVLAVTSAEAQARFTKAPIINGVTIPGAAAAVGKVIGSELGTCTGTLIGCSTVLTAAHCVCPEGPGSCATPPAVFFQHRGGVLVQGATVHPGYNGHIHDLAVLHLSEPASNLPTAPINQTARISYGTPIGMIGFGRAQGGDQATDGSTGILRQGTSITAPCQFNDAFNLCTNFSAPVGAPGEDSNTCNGDSGGPIIAGGTVAGVVSFGTNDSCLPLDHAVNADVFVDRAWIATAAAGDLGSLCPGPRVGELGVSVLVAEGQLSAGQEHFLPLDVPPNLAKLRVSLMAEDSADLDLQVSGPSGANCVSDLPLNLPEICAIENPTGGSWLVTPSGFEGAGEYQLVVTMIESPSSSGACVANAQTACLQGGRFEVKIGWSNSSGSGTGSVMSFGGQRAENNDSAFYSFQSPTNFEMGIKMLNACIPLFGNKFWVFVSGLTDQGWQVTVRDTQTGATKTYSNTQGNLSETFADTSAFDC